VLAFFCVLVAQPASFAATMLIVTLPLFNNCYLVSFQEVEVTLPRFYKSQVIECCGPLFIIFKAESLNNESLSGGKSNSREESTFISLISLTFFQHVQPYPRLPEAQHLCCSLLTENGLYRLTRTF